MAGLAGAEDQSAQRALEYLIDVSVGERLQRLGPCAFDAAPLGRRAHPAVPADLLHIIIELDAMPVRVERERGVIDARIQLRRDRVDKADAARFEECDRLAQLRVAGDLESQ